jgi:glycosyltransferase involved in cell wall biosynthesis
MMNPLVTVVTPSYNQAAFLGAAIESVLNQDYQPLEYMVIDGGSVDGSQEIIRSYQNRLRWWVSEPDQGQADAINKGFKRARGEILAWLNSDDLYFPGAVSSAVRIFQANPTAGLVYGNAVSADDEGRLLNELRFSSWGLKDLLEFNILCQPAVFMKRDLVEKVGYLDVSYHFFLDHQLWIRLARETELIHHPEIWAVSRYHDQAKNVTMAAKCGEEAYRILEWAEMEPDLGLIVEENYPKVWAGAHRINARYLLDGGLPWEAFKSYLRAARAWLPSLRTYWHRLLYSGLSALGLGFLGSWYYSLKHIRQPKLTAEVDLTGWEGIKTS